MQKLNLDNAGLGKVSVNDVCVLGSEPGQLSTKGGVAMSKSVRTLDLTRNGVDKDGVNSIELMLRTAPVLSPKLQRNPESEMENGVRKPEDLRSVQKSWRALRSWSSRWITSLLPHLDLRRQHDEECHEFLCMLGRTRSEEVLHKLAARYRSQVSTTPFPLQVHPGAAQVRGGKRSDISAHHSRSVPLNTLLI